MATEGVKPIVTLSALYGAGGSVVGPRVAKRLGVPFLDREISSAVAERTGLSTADVVQLEEGSHAGANRIVAALGRASTLRAAGDVARDDLDLHERSIRAVVEEFVARARVSGGVVLGHGGMVILRDCPSAVHVYLRGTAAARSRQAAAIEGTDLGTAKRRQQHEDRARVDYVRRAYGVDGEDPSLYHLIVDSTELDLDVCVELIVAASHARMSRTARSEAG